MTTSNNEQKKGGFGAFAAREEASAHARADATKAADGTPVPVTAVPKPSAEQVATPTPTVHTPSKS